MNKPYVYIIQNKDRSHWYVGVKLKPKTGEEYWGSSPYLKELMKESGKENWTKTIISEFDDEDIAHEFEQMLIEFMWDLPGRVNKAKSGFVDHSDPEVKAAHKAGVQKRSENPVYRTKLKAGCQKRSENPVYRANHKAGREKMKQDPVWQANQKVGAQKRSENPEYQAKNKAANQKRAKPFIATCIKTGEEFYCESGVCDQAKELKLNQGNVSSCLNGKLKQTNGFTFRYV